MRQKEEILDNFKAIQRHYLKQDLTQVEAEIQAQAILTEILIDIRTNIKAFLEEYKKHFPDTQKILEESKENSAKIRDVT